MRRQALSQHLGMPRGGHPIGEHLHGCQRLAVASEAEGQRAERLRHRAGLDHAKHRQAEMACQVSAAGRAVVQAHDAFHQDQVGFGRCLGKACGGVFGTGHPQVERVDRRTAGGGENGGIEVVGTALEDPDGAALAAVQPCQRGRHRGLALARGRRRHQHGGHAQGPCRIG